MSPPPDDPERPDGADEPGDPGPDRDEQIEAAASAYRPLRRDGIGSHPSWDDLDADGRVQSFELASTLRKLEAALDPDGQSTTVRAVLARLTPRDDPKP